MATKLITALDFPDAQSAMSLVKSVGDAGDFYKVGLELFIADGHKVLPALKDMGKKVFLDLKLHDIPNTAASALRSCLRYGADIIDIHVQGGIDMMKACSRVIDDVKGEKPLLIGVTLLTSLDSEHLREYKIESGSAGEYVLRLAALAKSAGLHGVVSSAHEVTALKSALGSSFITVTPGIRLPDSDTGDQKRIVTPAAAAKSGSDFIVVGRPITQSADPKGAVEKINEMILSV